MNILLVLLDWFGGAIVSLPLVMLFLFVADKKRFAGKWFWAALFALYMNAMLTIVGMPDFTCIVWDPSINFIPFHDFSLRNLLGMVLNIVMFIPFGAFLPFYFKRFRNVKTTVLSGFLMSLFIEILQLFTFRATDIDDLIMNTLGAFAGYGIAKLIVRKSGNSESEDWDIPKLIVMILIVCVVIAFVRYPLVGYLFQVLNL